MANVVFIEDNNGDTIEANYYCSDFCAQTDDSYAGCYGSVETEHDTVCGCCRVKIVGLTEV